MDFGFLRWSPKDADNIVAQQQRVFRKHFRAADRRPCTLSRAIGIIVALFMTFVGITPHFGDAFAFSRRLFVR